LDALPAKAGSASAPAIIKDKASIAAIFRSTLNTSYLHYVIIAQRHAQVPRPPCVAFNEEIVRDGDLFPSRKHIALACEAASVGDPASRLGLQLAISALPCFRASALRQFFDQHTIISFEQE
jgi:hypothetical protein